MMDNIGNHNAKVLSKESEQNVEIVNGEPKQCCEDQDTRHPSGINPNATQHYPNMFGS
jgi:hypothetical protein